MKKSSNFKSWMALIYQNQNALFSKTTECFILNLKTIYYYHQINRHQFHSKVTALWLSKLSLPLSNLTILIAIIFFNLNFDFLLYGYYFVQLNFYSSLILILHMNPSNLSNFTSENIELPGFRSAPRTLPSKVSCPQHDNVSSTRSRPT